MKPLLVVNGRLLNVDFDDGELLLLKDLEEEKKYPLGKTIMTHDREWFKKFEGLLDEDVTVELTSKGLVRNVY